MTRDLNSSSCAPYLSIIDFLITKGCFSCSKMAFRRSFWKVISYYGKIKHPICHSCQLLLRKDRSSQGRFPPFSDFLQSFIVKRQRKPLIGIEGNDIPSEVVAKNLEIALKFALKFSLHYWRHGKKQKRKIEFKNKNMSSDI